MSQGWGAGLASTSELFQRLANVADGCREVIVKRDGQGFIVRLGRFDGDRFVEVARAENRQLDPALRSLLRATSGKGAA